MFALLDIYFLGCLFHVTFFLYPSTMVDNFASLCILVKFGHLDPLRIELLSQVLLAFDIYVKKSAVTLMGFPLYLSYDFLSQLSIYFACSVNLVVEQ